MLFGLLFRSVRTHKYLVEYILVMVSFFALFAVQNVMINKTARYVTSLQHVVFYRFFPDQQKLSFLLAHGMPFDPRFLSYPQDDLLAKVGNSSWWMIPLVLLNTWLADHGKQVLYSYMFTHPGYAFMEPVAAVQSLLNGDVSDYRNILSPTPFRPLAARRPFCILKSRSSRFSFYYSLGYRYSLQLKIISQISHTFLFWCFLLLQSRSFILYGIRIPMTSPAMPCRQPF